LKVKVYSVNTTAGRKYGLINIRSGEVLYGATSKWKTQQGAEKFAAKRGYEVVR